MTLTFNRISQLLCYSMLRCNTLQQLLQRKVIVRHAAGSAHLEDMKGYRLFGSGFATRCCAAVFTLLSWHTSHAQVTNTYSHSYVHRPDLALLSYGFVPTREPPILSAVDLPDGFGEVQHPLQSFPETPVNEPGYGEQLVQLAPETSF